MNGDVVVVCNHKGSYIITFSIVWIYIKMINTQTIFERNTNLHLTPLVIVGKSFCEKAQKLEQTIWPCIDNIQSRKSL